MLETIAEEGHGELRVGATTEGDAREVGQEVVELSFALDELELNLFDRGYVLNSAYGLEGIPSTIVLELAHLVDPANFPLNEDPVLNGELPGPLRRLEGVFHQGPVVRVDAGVEEVLVYGRVVRDPEEVVCFGGPGEVARDEVKIPGADAGHGGDPREGG